MSSTSIDFLEQKWFQLALRRDWNSPDSESAREALFVCYQQPNRFYHSLEHMADGLDQWRQSELLEVGNRDGDALEMALWFHDVIYEIERNDNEKVSC